MARFHSNTIRMILLPSNTTRCSCFCINALRINYGKLQSNNKHIDTAYHNFSNLLLTLIIRSFALQHRPARLALVPISFHSLELFLFSYFQGRMKKDGKQKLMLIHMTRCYSILGNPSKPLLTYLRVNL